MRLDLHGAKPPVWRRLELPGDLTLPRVHDVIQAAMGWYDCHLHRFRTGNDHRSPYFVTDFDLDEGDDGMLEDDVRLDQLLAEKGDELWYEYDFGDGWDHKLGGRGGARRPAGDGALHRRADGLPARGLRRHRRLRGAGRLGPQWVRRRAPPGSLRGRRTRAATGCRSTGTPTTSTSRRPTPPSRSRSPSPSRSPASWPSWPSSWNAAASGCCGRCSGRPLSHGPTDVSDAEAARLTETYRIFLDVIGDGVALTAAGYLPPAVVEQIAERSGIGDWWIGKANREDLTYPVAEIRSTARALGLVSVRKGRLTPTAAATALCAGSAGAAGGTSSVGSRWAPRTPSARRAGWRSPWPAAAYRLEEWRSEISDLLFALGWRSGHDRFSPPPANSATLDVLEQLAGASRVRWGEIKGIDFAVAATARAAIRPT